MIKNTFLALVVGLVISASQSVSAQAGTYSMEVKVQATEATCLAQKATIERAMADSGAALGKDLSNVRVSCLADFTGKLASGENYRAYSVSIRYEVSGFPAQYTAHLGFRPASNEVGADRGIFETLDECMSSQLKALKFYEGWTGLKPVFWACMPDGVGTRFVLSITGFGQTKATLQGISLGRLYSEVLDLSQSEEHWVESQLASNGAQVLASQIGRYIFFAPKQIAMHIQNVGHWSEASQCEGQLPDAAAIFAGLDHHLECRTEPFENGKSLSNLRAIAMTNGLQMRDFGFTSAKYPSFDSCRQYLPEVVSEARESHSSFLGALCIPEGYESARFVIEKWSRF